MTEASAVPSIRSTEIGPKYAVVPVHGYDIVVSTVLLMLDQDSHGNRARAMGAGQQIPFGAEPVLVAPSTAYASACVEHLIRTWPVNCPRPWLVVVADVPAPPAAAARFRFRALQGRLAGIAHVPYLSVLRTVDSPHAALADKAVRRAAAGLRRQLEGE